MLAFFGCKEAHIAPPRMTHQSVQSLPSKSDYRMAAYEKPTVILASLLGLNVFRELLRAIRR